MKKILILMGMASACFAASDPSITLDALKKVEGSINDKLRSNVNEPYDLLGRARGTYLEGYGAVFTIDINVVVMPLLMVSPFTPKPTDGDILKLHERKIHKVAALKESMRDLIASAAQNLPGLASDDRVVMEAILFNYAWENAAGIPHRIVMSARKQKLVDAVNRHAAPPEIAALFEEREL